MNDKEVQIEVTLVDKKQLKEVRAKIKAEEEIARLAKEAAEKKAKEDAIAAKNEAEELILKTEFGKNIIKRTYDYDMIVRWVTEGKLTEKFLNAKSVTDLISEEMIKDKDYLRISDILKKSDLLYRGNNKSLMASLDLNKARKLAKQQGDKIKDETKRIRRKEAANAIGAGWLAGYF